MLTPGPKRDDAYRAIGRYFYEFSRMMLHMRSALETKLDEGLEEKIAGLALGEIAPMNLTKVFFETCQTVADLDEEEMRIGRRLKKEVGDEVTRRNDFAHGDWVLGGVGFGDVPGLLRIKPGRSSGARKLEVFEVPEIDRISDDLYRLRQKVAEYGLICLGLHPRVVETHNPYRVRSAFRMEKKEVVEVGERSFEHS